MSDVDMIEGRMRPLDDVQEEANIATIRVMLWLLAMEMLVMLGRLAYVGGVILGQHLSL